MVIPVLLSCVAILVAWTVLDTLMHRLLLHPLYAENPQLWRPFDTLSIPLIYVATFTLIGIFAGMYVLLIQPKSFGAGLGLGAFLGLALGVASGLGTYIHMPIPRPLALAWVAGGFLRGVVAGGILGLIIPAT